MLARRIDRSFERKISKAGKVSATGGRLPLAVVDLVPPHGDGDKRQAGDEQDIQHGPPNEPDARRVPVGPAAPDNN